MFEQTPSEKAVNMIRVHLDAVQESIRYNHAEWRTCRKRDWPRVIAYHETMIAVKVREAKFLKRLLKELAQA